MIQKLGDGKKAPQIFCLERAVVLKSTPQVKTENLRQSRRCQNQFLNHERYSYSNLSRYTFFPSSKAKGWPTSILIPLSFIFVRRR